MKIHWVYVWLANPVGFLLTLRPVVYVGETNNRRRRTQTHRRSSWWRWLTIGVPIPIPMPRWAAMRVERALVQVLRPVANREYNGRRALSAGVVRRRALTLILLVVGALAGIALRGCF